MSNELPPDFPPHVECTIAYEHKYRKVYATRLWKSKAGKWLITAWDPDVNEGAGGWRSFRADRVQGQIHILND